MLRPEYRRKIATPHCKDKAMDMAEEVLDAAFPPKKLSFFGMDFGHEDGSKTSISPYVAIKSVIAKSGKTMLVPVVGIKGTF